MGKLAKTILTLSLLSILISGCYNSIGYKSNPAQVINTQLYVSPPMDNRNYKVVLSNGKTKNYCCIDRVQDNVVFFQKVKKDDGNKFYLEPHGYPMSQIKDVKYWNGESFGNFFGAFMGELFIMSIETAIDVGVDAAFSGSSNDRDKERSSRSGSKSRKLSSKSSNSKTVTGKRPRR